MSRMRFDFAVVGVQKAGTTTLEWALRQHPDVSRPPRKEMHYFDDEAVDWSAPDYEGDYSAPRRSSRHRRLGDATPTYLFWPHALERMRRYDPDLRLIAVFRDPLERLFSHWAHARARTARRTDWPRFITRFAEPSLPTELPEGVSPTRYAHLSGVARGYYGAQLERGLTLFPREQWLLLEFGSMLADFAGTLTSVTDHLGLEPFERPPALQARNPGEEKVVGTPPTAAELADLAALYAADLGVFESLAGLDTSRWATRRILDGTLDPHDLAARFAARISPAADEPRGG